MVDWVPLLAPGSVARAVAGAAVFWFPGLAWAWALGGELGWHRWLPISIVLAFTVQPMVMFFANLVAGLPITLATTAMACVALGLAGLTVGMRPRVRTLLEL